MQIAVDVRPTVHLPLVKIVIGIDIHLHAEVADSRQWRRIQVVRTDKDAVDLRTAVAPDGGHGNTGIRPFGKLVVDGVDVLDAFGRRPRVVNNGLLGIVVDAHARKSLAIATDGITQVKACNPALTHALDLTGDIDGTKALLSVATGGFRTAEAVSLGIPNPMRAEFACRSRTAIIVVIVVRELSPIRTFVDLLLAIARSDPDLHLVVIGSVVELGTGNGVRIRDDEENFVGVELAGATRPIVVANLAKPDGGASFPARLDVE